MTQLDPNHKFIEAWGIMASSWGVSRSESQVYALLLVRNEVMSSEEIMKELHMSRGNAHAVLHTLMDYELVFKSHKLGERREYFRAETDLWVVMDKMMKYMKRRSLDRFVEIVSEITPDQEISASSSHLEKLKSNIKGISTAFNSAFEYLPVLQKEFAYSSANQGQIIQLSR
ncbi:MAG: helix-turn-helix domain-containing protein [Saprospiraceae bacterium]